MSAIYYGFFQTGLRHEVDDMFVQAVCLVRSASETSNLVVIGSGRESGLEWWKRSAPFSSMNCGNSSNQRGTSYFILIH